MNSRTHVIQRLLLKLRKISRSLLCSAPPRLPIMVPRADVRKILANGSTRFCRGILKITGWHVSLPHLVHPAASRPGPFHNRAGCGLFEIAERDFRPAKRLESPAGVASVRRKVYSTAGLEPPCRLSGAEVSATALPYDSAPRPKSIARARNNHPLNPLVQPAGSGQF